METVIIQQSEAILLFKSYCILSDVIFVPVDLNDRDVWSDPTVKEVLLCSFIFWQQQRLSPEGAKFCQRYQVTYCTILYSILCRNALLSILKKSIQMVSVLLTEAILLCVIHYSCPYVRRCQSTLIYLS